jgi:hypothetical protein
VRGRCACRSGGGNEGKRESGAGGKERDVARLRDEYGHGLAQPNATGAGREE